MRLKNRETRPSSDTEELELFVARSGALSARVNRDGGLLHVHSLVHPADEARYFGAPAFWGDLIVFLGTGLGYHVLPYLSGIPAGSKILLVDYYRRCIDHCLENGFNRLPNGIGVLSHADPDWRGIAARASGGAATIQIVKHPASYRVNRDFYDAVLGALRFRRAAKSENGPPLLFYGNFFLEEELRRALERGGRGVTLFRYNEYSGAERLEPALDRVIQERRPEFILSVNMKGFDANGAVTGSAARFGVPAAIWFVDDPHPVLASLGNAAGSNVTAFCWERAYLPWLSRQGFGGVHYLPLAADPSLFDCSGGNTGLAGIGFVGSAMGRAYLDTIAARFLWSKELEPLVETAARALLADVRLPVHDLVRETSRATGLTFPFSDKKNVAWFCSYVIHTASMMRRKELVSACIPLGVQTFGDPSGWRQLLGDAVPTHPDIDYRTGLSAIYRTIVVTLNITSRQMPTTVNQRVFDVPLCGGFVLNDRQNDLFELFAPDEIAVYESKQALVEKAVFFRDHERERQAISRKARNRILAEHTYDHRLQRIRELLFL